MFTRFTLPVLLMVTLFVVGCDSEQPTVMDSDQALLAPPQGKSLALVINAHDEPVSVVLVPARAISKSPALIAVDVAIYVVDDDIWLLAAEPIDSTADPEQIVSDALADYKGVSVSRLDTGLCPYMAEVTGIDADTLVDLLGDFFLYFAPAGKLATIWGNIT